MEMHSPFAHIDRGHSNPPNAAKSFTRNDFLSCNRPVQPVPKLLLFAKSLLFLRGFVITPAALMGNDIFVQLTVIPMTALFKFSLLCLARSRLSPTSADTWHGLPVNYDMYFHDFPSFLNGTDDRTQNQGEDGKNDQKYSVTGIYGTNPVNASPTTCSPFPIVVGRGYQICFLSEALHPANDTATAAAANVIARRFLVTCFIIISPFLVFVSEIYNYYYFSNFNNNCDVTYYTILICFEI